MSQLPDPTSKPGSWRDRWLTPLALGVAVALLALALWYWYRTRNLPLCDLVLGATVLLLVLVPVWQARRNGPRRP
jgi:4-hydroxybenzoate polyprenyltransferase